ncbi:MAG TPA: hypothetical protein VGF94_29675 [Kofleriaceae bacterium]
MIRAALALVGLAACGTTTGTLTLTLTTAPGSHVLDAATELRLVLTNPHQVTTASRGSGGFSLALDVPANGDTTSLIVDALDGTGATIATGSSPAFALGGTDAAIVVYMAAPNTIGAAPAQFATARSALGSGVLMYGAVFSGGLDASGAATTELEIYNAYDHSLIEGLAMPDARSAQIVAVGSTGLVFLYGGNDSTGATTETLWSFDTTVAPNGSYSQLATTSLPRAGEPAVPISSNEELVPGMPAIDLVGPTGSATAVTDVPSLPSAGASVLDTDGTATAIFADATGVVRYHAGAYDAPAIAGGARAGAAVVALPGSGAIAIACGTPDGVSIDAATEAVTPRPGVPGVAKTGCAIAATARVVLIAGGTLATGGLDPDAQIFDAATFAPVATVPLVVPRTGATALPLPNGQIVIAGGVDASGAPIATIELFTPASTE